MPKASNIMGGAAGPINPSALIMETSMSKRTSFEHTAKRIAIKTGFWIKRFPVVFTLNDVREFAIKSVEMMKNAKVIVASQSTTALIGKFPPVPYINCEIGQIYINVLTNTTHIETNQASRNSSFNSFSEIIKVIKNKRPCARA